jgi:hypothetical protein
MHSTDGNQGFSTLELPIPTGKHCDEPRQGHKKLSRNNILAWRCCLGVSAKPTASPESTSSPLPSTHLEAWLPLEQPPILIYVAVVIQDVDEVQLVPLPHHEIIGVMSRCDLHSTSTKGHVHQLCITDDGNLVVMHRVDDMLAMEVLVPGIQEQHRTWHDKPEMPCLQ